MFRVLNISLGHSQNRRGEGRREGMRHFGRASVVLRFFFFFIFKQGFFSFLDKEGGGNTRHASTSRSPCATTIAAIIAPLRRRFRAHKEAIEEEGEGEAKKTDTQKWKYKFFGTKVKKACIFLKNTKKKARLSFECLKKNCLHSLFSCVPSLHPTSTNFSLFNFKCRKMEGGAGTAGDFPNVESTKKEEMNAEKYSNASRFLFVSLVSFWFFFRFQTTRWRGGLEEYRAASSRGGPHARPEKARVEFLLHFCVVCFHTKKNNIVSYLFFQWFFFTVWKVKKTLKKRMQSCQSDDRLLACLPPSENKLASSKPTTSRYENQIKT